MIMMIMHVTRQVGSAGRKVKNSPSDDPGK